MDLGVCQIIFRRTTTRGGTAASLPRARYRVCPAVLAHIQWCRRRAPCPPATPSQKVLLFDKAASFCPGTIGVCMLLTENNRQSSQLKRPRVAHFIAARGDKMLCRRWLYAMDPPGVQTGVEPISIERKAVRRKQLHVPGMNGTKWAIETSDR